MSAKLERSPETEAVKLLIAGDLVSSAQTEPAHTLANDAREELRAAGFTDDEIDDWAREFAAHEDAGDTEAFIAWIKKEEAR